MLVKVLGSAAGGGFPQWNCACRNCAGFRVGTLRAKARTQTQIAFSPAPAVWFLVGASPDLRQQILSTAELSPSAREPARLPIAGVFLLSADVDSVMGLLHLREFQSLTIFATPTVQRILREQNSIFRVLERSRPRVHWQPLCSRQRSACGAPGISGVDPAFYSIVTLGGSYPDYCLDAVPGSAAPEDASVGLLVEQADKKLFIAPSLPQHNFEAGIGCAASSTVAFLDGTFWSNEELLKTGRSNKTARDMGHVPLSAPDGLLARYPKNASGRKILIHMNNTNPILDEDSDEHHVVVQTGFEIAYDGLDIEL